MTDGNETLEPAQPAEAPTATAGQETITSEQLEELRAKASKAEENWDRYLRVTADLDNFKKRAARERQEATKFANESILERLIPVLDNFDMALSAANSSQATSVESLKTGVNMIHSQLRSALADSGLEEIEATGQAFNPNLHEAVSQKETTEVPDGQVVQQLRKGYKLRERLLRPATVVVSRNPKA